MKNAIIVIKIQKNLNMFILETINKLLNILKNHIFIVKLETVSIPNFKMYLLLKKHSMIIFSDNIKRQKNLINPL